MRGVDARATENAGPRRLTSRAQTSLRIEEVSLFAYDSIVAEERQQRFAAGDSVPTAARREFIACGSAHPRRSEAEAFVRARFHRAHGAHIVTFMPSLLLMTDARGNLDAVLGCRRADGDRLFLERYLPRPIQDEIAAHTGARVSRSRIAEIGNFAARNSQVAGTFMSYLASHLLDRGLTWIAFTATDAIRRILASLEAPCADLGAADGGQVASGPDRWGSYYSHDPRVMAGYLPNARRIPALWKTRHAD